MSQHDDRPRRPPADRADASRAGPAQAQPTRRSRGDDSTGDERPRRRRTTDDRPRDDRPRDDRPARPPRALSPAAAAQAGLRQVADLTGRDPQGVVFLEAADDGWVVGVEVVEDHRIPSSADILALYEATVDADGQLVGYSRRHRYPRGKGDDGRAGS